MFIIELIVFVLLVNWIASLHVLNNMSPSKNIRVVSIIVAIVASIILGIIAI